VISEIAFGMWRHTIRPMSLKLFDPGPIRARNPQKSGLGTFSSLSFSSPLPKILSAVSERLKLPTTWCHTIPTRIVDNKTSNFDNPGFDCL
jgi:hypothetical protein